MLQGSKDHSIVPHTIKIAFNLDTESADKARTIVNNVDKALVKKKMLMFGSKKIDTVKNTDIHYIYNDLYLSEKELEGRRGKKGGRYGIGNYN